MENSSILNAVTGGKPVQFEVKLETKSLVIFGVVVIVAAAAIIIIRKLANN